jgi:uncharacterized protein (DUF433 family)
MKYLSLHPDVIGGELALKGTRIGIALVFQCLAAGETVEKMLQGWPWLVEETLRGAMAEAIKYLEIPPSLVPTHV